MKKRLGKNMAAIVQHMESGKHLNRFFEGGACVFVIEGVGDVSGDSVKRLLESGIIRENADAMFGVGQSYSLTKGE